MINTQEDFFIKIYTSHFIASVRKGCSRFACERELETEHYWNILTPKLWSATLCLSRSPLGPNSIRAPECGFPYHSSTPTGTRTQLSCFCSIGRPYITFKLPRGNMDTPPQFLPISGDRDVSLPLSLEWPEWSSSSGNNCHAVQRPLSSGASVYESIMGFFFISSHFISQFPPTRFPLTTATRMYHLLPVHHLEWHIWPGQKVKI